MGSQLHTIDYLVFLVYFVGIALYGYWIYQRKHNEQESAASFFLAEGALTWWAIGASLIASNISAEQFIGMSGSGFAMGLAIASYEWMAAATLLVVAVFFLPIYLRNRIYTMPQFWRSGIVRWWPPLWRYFGWWYTYLSTSPLFYTSVPWR